VMGDARRIIKRLRGKGGMRGAMLNTHVQESLKEENNRSGKPGARPEARA